MTVQDLSAGCFLPLKLDCGKRRQAPGRKFSKVLDVQILFGQHAYRIVTLIPRGGKQLAG